ncbi:GIDE domain-containing protein [Halopiger aswanensis]|uniref:RING-type E3 ubiquitin transferase n=1 Tax=Halopiger aswanensis TaxID=148449 RepID=A0A3R7FVC6_9EURY|nr:GIDE domain-containing protein [Halopiger aswanensis]RKD94886.1 E3 ubiquitin ligase [Halopiger aswanensis]
MSTASLTPLPAATITGIDVLVLLLLLHLWLLVVGLAVWNDEAQTGVAWVDQRIHMSNRLYGALMFLAVVVVWLPFTLGGYPFGANNPFGRSRTVLIPVAAGGLLVGSGFYFLGGVITNVRSYLAFRLTDPVDAETVDSSRVRITGEIVPADDPLEAPLSGSDAVCYQLSQTQVAFEDSLETDAGAGAATTGLLSSLVDGTERVADRRRPFWLRDDTGRVLVDPGGAELRLERTASQPVATDERPPEPIATRLREAVDDGDERRDQDRVYHEAVLEPGATVSVLGVAVAPEDRAVAGESGDNSNVPLITAGESSSEFIISPVRADGIDRHYLVTLFGCALAALASIGSGFGLLWLLAGY